ncbi:MAG: hypothetical protein H6582_12475 [Crocinitomicaceae bacterium]|nr:hypothetical protein [Crocinitomicaceae bacterium]
MNPEVKVVLREIFTKAILKNVLIAGAVIFLHYLVIGTWAYQSFEIKPVVRIAISVGLVASFTSFVWSVWAARAITIDGYRILHEKYVKYWVKDYCDKQAELILKEGSPTDGLFIDELRKWLLDKAQKVSPKVYQWVKFILRKFKVMHIMDTIENYRNQNDREGLSNYLNDMVCQALMERVDAIVPAFIKYLIPFTIGSVIAIWFI